MNSEYINEVSKTTSLFKRWNNVIAGEGSEEYQYLDLIREVLDNGSREETRNGETISIFGNMSKYSLLGGKLPLLTTKKVAWKTCLRELLWFISGSTDNGVLREQKVKIWNDNATREFQELQGLYYEDENDLGPVYGHQWRHFNAEYSDCHADYSDKGVDQLQNIIDSLKDEKKRTSRRLILCAWNPCQLKEMVLPPCHAFIQFNVTQNKYLECSLYQRSGDIGLGVPFNIASYSFLTHLLAHHCGLEAKTLVHTIGNAHIYSSHEEILKGQLERDCLDFPTLSIKNKYDSIDDYKIEDFEVVHYNHQGELRMPFVT